MKILLTGIPGSGKSTLLANLVGHVNSKQGLFSPEVRENGVRIGFDLKDAAGKTAALSRTAKPTDYPVGRYFVDAKSLDQFMEHLFQYQPDQLLFIDEIGQMQLYSSRFHDLVSDYLDSSNDFLGTISQVYSSSFTKELLQRKDILLCSVTPEYRDSLMVALKEAINHRKIFDSLPFTVQRKVLELAQGYLKRDQYIPFKKLFKNALTYVAAEKVKQHDDGYVVQGFTNQHRIHYADGKLVCDCDLFKGKGRFAGNSGECSHIQSVKLISA